MSQENVEIVRRHMEAFLSGDFETALAAYHPEAEFDASVRPEGGVHRGPDGVAEAVRDWGGMWDEWKVEIESVLDAGERVLMIVRESGRGKGSGATTQQRVYNVFTLSDGRIVHMKNFLDRDEAFEAAGLSE